MRAPYLVLLRAGFTVPVLLPVPRWALTPPFHPYLQPKRKAVYSLLHFPSARAGRLLAVALSYGSPDFPPAWGYPHTSDCPAVWSDRSL